MKTRILLFSLFLSFIGYSQEVSYYFNIEKHETKNEYRISSFFKGLTGADLAKIKFTLPKGSVIVPSNGSITSELKGDNLNFYAYSVGSSGELSTTYLVIPDEDNSKISTILNYAIGDERSVFTCDPIVLNSSEALAKYTVDYSNEKVQKIEASAGNEIAENSSSNSSNGSSSSSSNGSSSSSNEGIVTDNSIGTNLSNNTSSNKTEETKVENKVKTTPVVSSAKAESGAYTVQIMSLSSFSEDRLTEYCRKHNVDRSEIVLRKVDGLTKVSIGSYSSREKATDKKNLLSSSNGIEKAFVVKID